MKLLDLFLHDLQEKLLLHLHKVSCWWQGQALIIHWVCPQEENEDHYMTAFFCWHPLWGTYLHCCWPKEVSSSIQIYMSIYVCTYMAMHPMHNSCAFSYMCRHLTPCVWFVSGNQYSSNTRGACRAPLPSQESLFLVQFTLATWYWVSGPAYLTGTLPIYWECINSGSKRRQQGT